MSVGPLISCLSVELGLTIGFSSRRSTASLLCSSRLELREYDDDGYVTDS